MISDMELPLAHVQPSFSSLAVQHEQPPAPQQAPPPQPPTPQPLQDSEQQHQQQPEPEHQHHHQEHHHQDHHQDHHHAEPQQQHTAASSAAGVQCYSMVSSPASLTIVNAGPVYSHVQVSNNNSILGSPLMDNACLFSPGATSMSGVGDHQYNLHQDPLPDTKEGIEELCPVCGDKVSGYHYGLLTCESCKGFFKRTVQNKKVYTCVADKSCQIDKTQRKRCPFCRFQKCLSVGMKLEAVRQDRMRGGRNKFGPMYKRDRARKMQQIRQRQLMGPQRVGLPPVGSEAVTISYPSPATSLPITYSAGNGSNITIKQEIQYPVLSSTSASSPDSSPSPLLGAPAGSGALLEPWGAGRTDVPTIIRELVASLDDREWQQQLFRLLQTQTYNQCEVDLFELLCKVLDTNLFTQVDWARNSVFFKDLRVEDQMKLLQATWSVIMILDHIHQRLHNNLPDSTTLPNGQKFDLLTLSLFGMSELVPQLNDVTARLQELSFDVSDYICLKFVLLLDPNLQTLGNRRHVQQAQDQVKQAHMDYCAAVHPDIQGKYQRLMALLPELRDLALRGEDYLYQKHDQNDHNRATSLLIEMLHARRHCGRLPAP
ncbi:Nuclear hormone receptor FTZ-F1 [Amphibalanus amphitrite]|uniref:Nuclear hormone receptor FTZ-F1 n=1 Tax=Amphibalanus amphitrite TaxID=1232801 RepID=A0A6A4WHJ5_AMPAM|nr:nuclear hormone receptor FTZ-F1-like isoform X2 [Amphibalanus amphitrite]KAF0301441.1 Nuclear hormone receptor FTZ-F1 [Amphibalanus amphitrite]